MKQILLAYSPLGRLTTLLLLLGLWWGTGPARAQTPAWQLALSGISNQPTGGTSAATATAVNAAGDVFITGSFRGEVAFGNYSLATTGLTDDDVFVAKWSTASASWEWAVRAGGSGPDTGSGIAIGSAGEVYVTGTFVNTSTNGNGVVFGGVGLNGSGTTANKDAFVAKYNDAGLNGVTLDWARHGGGDGDDFGNAIAVSGTSVFITGSIENNAANGNNVLFGTAALTGSGTVLNSDAILIKYADNGSTATTAWARRGGGTGTDVGYGVAASSNGVYITGSFINDGSNSNLVNFSGSILVGSGPVGNFEMFLLKYADNGSSATLKWAQTGGGNGSDQGSAVTLLGTSVYLTGNFTNNSANANSVDFAGTTLAGTGSSTNFDMFVARYSDNTTSAALGWVYHGGGTGNDFGNGLAVSGIGVYVTGNYTNDNTNSRGVLFGSTGLTGTGSTANFDGFVVRYGDLGSLAGVTWAQHGGSTGADDSNGIAVNGTTLCVASGTGGFSGVATFGPQWQAPIDAAVLGTLQASTGTWLGADTPLLGGAYSRTNATATDAAGNVFVTGSYAGQVAFGNTVLTASNVQNIFVAKWSPVSGWLWAMQGGGDGTDLGQGIAVTSGGVYITGYVENNAADALRVRFGATAVPGTGPSNNTDVFVAKYTDNGTSATLAWVTADGGNGTDHGYGIAAVGSNIYVTGSSYNDVGNSQAVKFGPNTVLGRGATSPSSDVLLACYHDLGSSVTVTWGEVFGGSSSDEGYAIAARGSEIFLTGYYSNNSANVTNTQFNSGLQMPGSGSSINIEVFTAKLLDNGVFGTFKWVQHGGGGGNDYGRAIAVSGSSVYVAGDYVNNAADSQGVLFGGQTLLCAGTSLNDDAFLLKYTDNLNSATQVWVQQGGGSSRDGSTGLAVSGSQLYITGFSGNSTSNVANVSFGGVPLAGTGSIATYDAYVVKYTDNGATATANWAQHGGGNLDDQANGIALDGPKVYIAGEMRPSATFGTFSLVTPTNGSLTNFLAQLLDVPVPILTSIVPNSGPVGTTTVLNGSNLTGATTITFAGASGNTVGSGFVVNAAGTQITGVVVPAGAVTGSVTVTTSGGQSNGVMFTVILPPTLTSINPTSGIVGATILLTGTDFTGATSVSFNGTNAVSFSALSATQAVATVPVGATTGNVTITTPGGTSNGVLFTVKPTPAAPTITSFTPASGPVGTVVSITGTGFTGAGGSGFNFNGTFAPVSTVLSATAATATVPAGASTGTITFSNLGGTATSPTSFVVTVPPVAPTLTSLSPTGGVVGATVTLTGTGFTGATAVHFNGTSTSVTVLNATTATVMVPWTNTMANTVTITTPAGTSNGVAFEVYIDLLVGTLGTSILPGAYHSITVQATGSGTLQGPVAVLGATTVQAGGVLNTNCQAITGGASFTLDAGGTLLVCDPAGLSAAGASGAVQNTGARSFSPDANYEYNGSVAQVTGSGLPAQARNLTVNNPAGLTLTQPLAVAQRLRLAPGSGNFALNGQALTLLSDASGTALVANEGAGLVLGGTATVQRYLDPSLNAGLGYRHYSAPVSGATVASLTTPGFAPVVNPAYNTSATPGTTTPFPTVFGYDQARLATATNNLGAFDKGWVSPTTITSAALAPGTGYAVNLAATEKVAFTGSLNSGTLALPLGRNAGPTAAAGGWALVGNPYPAPLDWSLIAPADLVNLDASMYVFESSSQYAGSYRSYVNGIGISPLIASSQGFFVRVSAGQTSGSLTFRNSQRIGTYATQVALHRGSADTRPQLTLRLQGPTLHDDLTVYTQAGASAGADAAFDAGKLLNSTGLNLSAVAGGEELAIQGLPLLTRATVVPLTVRVPAAGGYALQLTQLLSMPATTQIVLTDALTGQRLDVRTLPASGYAFNLTAAQTTVAGRFSLNFMPNAAPLSNAPELALASVSVYPNPATGRTTVQLPAVAGATSATLVLLDALGRTVLTRVVTLPAAGREEVLDLHGLATGIYLLRVTAGAATAVRRLVVE